MDSEQHSDNESDKSYVTAEQTQPFAGNIGDKVLCHIDSDTKE